MFRRPGELRTCLCTVGSRHRRLKLSVGSRHRRLKLSVGSRHRRLWNCRSGPVIGDSEIVGRVPSSGSLKLSVCSDNLSSRESSPSSRGFFKGHVTVIIYLYDFDIWYMVCCNMDRVDVNVYMNLKLIVAHYTYIQKKVKGKVYIYEGELKSKGKIHLTALIEVTVSNFTYHFPT